MELDIELLAMMRRQVAEIKYENLLWELDEAHEEKSPGFLIKRGKLALRVFDIVFI